jgi:16S rRNA C967 or C1407 C5-methylase (RsmB/RsmF family)/NOL1/NOP2/fmu family ribosome biogenesis protein
MRKNGGYYMLPELFMKRMRDTLGDEYADFEESFSHERYQALRLNILKTDINGQNCTELKDKMPFELTPVSWAENGYYYAADDQPGKHPYHEAGVYYIQEPSAMAPVPMLEVRPGDKVLDLCAAPGGKSTQIASYLRGDGILVCNEINPQRAKILSENIERMGVCNACVTNETPERLSQFFPVYFDKILVDAPCSGEGMFRKNEDACTEWSPENVQMCAERQDGILREAAKMLRPGGRLVYSTCTFAEAEDEGSVERFTATHPEFKILKTERLWPHKVKGEGHFAAVLLKEGAETADYHTIPQAGIEKGLSCKDISGLEEFLCELIPDTAAACKALKFSKFGDNIYLIPDEMPSVKGLRVLRTGLHVATVRKNRFEPAHALALAVKPSDVRHVINLDTSNNTVAQYLNGQTFNADGEKGWYLICADGFSLGWGKLAGGIMKNHYPKGLRVNY